MTSSTDPGTRSTADIERDLEEDRRRLRETGQALQDRLSVGTVVDELLSRTREHGSDYAGNLGRTIRDNPIPVTLIGICLAWLVAGGQRASEERFRSDRGNGRALDLDEEGGYPRPAAPYAPPPPVDPVTTDPMGRPMAEPGPAAPLEEEPLGEPPPAVGPAGPVGPHPRPGGDIAASAPPDPPRPGPLGGAVADDPLRADTDDEPSPRPAPFGGGTAAGADEEPLRLSGGTPGARPHPPEDEEEEPLTLGEGSRSSDPGSSTPTPRPEEAPGSRPSWYRDDKDKP